jgi:hypothetical protein
VAGNAMSRNLFECVQEQFIRDYLDENPEADIWEAEEAFEALSSIELSTLTANLCARAVDAANHIKEARHV